METKQIAQFLGIFILIVMALSMLAGALLYVDRGDNTNTQNNQLDVPIPTDTQFTYDLNFNTTAIKDLDSARIGLMTASLNKAEIDSAILKTEGVSKVNSQFQKTGADTNTWLYLADVTLKKNTDVLIVLQKIVDLNYFDKTSRPSAMKYMTISAPPWVMIHNTNLNIDRNFALTQTTLMTLTELTTTPSDEIEVEGQITVQGKAMLSINLYEKQNYTKQQELQQIDLNMPTDTNTLVDTNKS